MADSSTVLIHKDASRFIMQCGYMYRDEQNISKALHCSICSEPWVQPLMANTCGHIFCARCIHTWIRHIPSCPIDRSSLPPQQLNEPPRILKELLEELEVVCSLGCGWFGRRDCWKTHLETDCPEAEDDQTTFPSALLNEKSESTESKDEKENLQNRWKKLAREILVLKREAKDYIATIEQFKNKISQLQLLFRSTNLTVSVDPFSVSTTTPTPTPSSSSSPPETTPVLHQATCDFCRSHIQGTRHKCLKCPDLDSCSDCFSDINKLHPIHDFVSIHSPNDANIICLPEWRIVHPDVRCNHCEQQVVGPRFKCVICIDYDLCHHCIALPRPVHPIGHPMTRFVNPQSGPT